MSKVKKSQEVDYDIVIAGAGIAGMAAAASAAESAEKIGEKISILVIDRADEKNYGGLSRWTGAFFQLENDFSISPMLEKEFIEFSKGKVDLKLLKTFLGNARETIEWLKEKGVEFETNIMDKTPYIAWRYNFIHPKLGGFGILSALESTARRLGVNFAFETTALKLMLSEDGSINGLFVRVKDGSLIKLRTSAVILTTGGCEGDLGKLAQYLGANAYLLGMYSPGEYYNKGEGIRMVEEIGGKLAGQFGLNHVGVGDARSNAVMPVVNIFPYGILVNKRGKRFIDEGADYLPDHSNTVGLAILQQPDNLAYVICDQKINSIPNWKRAILSDHPPIICNTIEEISRIIGCSFSDLKKTIDDYNSSIKEGEFNPYRLDGKGTSGLEPPKSNWALPLDTPPFIVYPVRAILSHTCFGVAIDERCRVLNSDDKPINGLYAAGEIIGMEYFRYVMATSVFRACVFGKIAGKEAVNYVLNKLGEKGKN